MLEPELKIYSIRIKTGLRQSMQNILDFFLVIQISDKKIKLDNGIMIPSNYLVERKEFA